MFISSLKRRLRPFCFISHFNGGKKSRVKLHFFLLALLFGIISNSSGQIQAIHFRYQNAGAFSGLIHDTAHLIISPEETSREGYFILRLYKGLMNAQVEKILVDTVETSLLDKLDLSFLRIKRLQLNRIYQRGNLDFTFYTMHTFTHSIKENSSLYYRFADTLRYYQFNRERGMGGVGRPADVLLNLDIGLLKDTTRPTTLFLNISINGDINYVKNVRPIRIGRGSIDLGLEYVKHPTQNHIQKLVAIDDSMLQNIVQSTSKIRINEDDQFYYLYFVLVR